MPASFSKRISQEDLAILGTERYTHPHPKVQRRMEVLWLIGQGLTIKEAARLAGVCLLTAKRHADLYKKQGLEGLRTFQWRKPTGQMLAFRDTLAESFRNEPPHTVNEACARIKALTGVERKPTQVRAFLKKLSA